MKTRELTTVAEMLNNIELMRFLYPSFTFEKYEAYLKDMVPHNYKQLAVYENDICVAVTGFWTATKLWSGRYIEIDNFIVHPDHRSKGLGKMMTDYIDVKAKEEGCSMIVLDAFTGNFTAHRFYYNQGYGPKGFHFVKIINEDGLS
ncbi:Acetyltransferase (GNAT) family protein [Flavobacterium gillisiae]|uniref:Acetyltransferase (GNAT) family protein n=2 Tax=Flavobacterium gillisiae TaxID=150146 RepID=A0A1H3ZC38_9FLAO|nr:Acetyltransferase (GNAT) family protein [Flavobacterium gillisiae]